MSEVLQEAIFLLTNYPQLFEENRRQKDEFLFASNRREAFTTAFKQGQILSDPTANKAIRMAGLPWEKEIALVRGFLEELSTKEKRLVILVWRYNNYSESWRLIQKNFGECTDCLQLWGKVVRKFANYLNRYAGTVSAQLGSAYAPGRKKPLRE